MAAMRGAAAALAVLAAARAVPVKQPGLGGRAGPVFNLTDFGAVGDNATVNTKAFTKAVAAVAAANGGTLVVPKGSFVTAPFNLTSKMTLFLDAGAEIRAPTAEQLGGGPEFPEWPIIAPMPSYGQGRDHVGPRRTALIGGAYLEDVVVTSAADAWGTIDGNGYPWWACHCNSRTPESPDSHLRVGGDCSLDWGYKCPGKETVTRGHLIEFMHSSMIEISNLRLRNSPFWTVHPFDCQHVVVRNIDIWAPVGSPNTDGVDPDSCADVLIENFSYHGGDDVIAIKSGWDCFGYHYNHSTRDVVIRNVTAIYSEAAGVAIGSEMSGGMENISIHDCDFTQTRTGFDIKYSAYRGGYVRDIHYRNMVIGNTKDGALTVNSNYGSKNPSCPSMNKVPCPVGTITYTNISQAPGTSVPVIIDFEGLPTNTIQGIMIDGVQLDGPQAVKCSLVSGTYKNCEKCSKCQGLVPAQ